MKKFRALLKVSVSCATSTSQMKPRFWLLMPKSTTLCVRKGSISCIPLPSSSPSSIGAAQKTGLSFASE